MSATAQKIIIFCAPSGSGKTTLAKEVMKRMPELSFSVSATNRLRREGETDGIDYWFLATEIFKERVARGDFVEWEEVYPGRFYGTLKFEVERLFSENKVPVFDIEFKGATNLKKLYTNNALIIFVKVPVEIVKQRLINRNTETQETLNTRIERFEEEMRYESSADKIVENIDLLIATHDAMKIISDFLKS
jgi:guanylate kinase